MYKSPTTSYIVDFIFVCHYIFRNMFIATFVHFPTDEACLGPHESTSSPSDAHHDSCPIPLLPTGVVRQIMKSVDSGITSGSSL